MPNHPISLTVLHPCTRTWNSLESVSGDRTRRYCDQCDLHVNNVSELSDAQAHQLMLTPGRVCISGIAKSDGILLTKSRLREEARIHIRRRPLLRIAAALGLISLPTALIACNQKSTTPDSSTSSTSPQEPTTQSNNPTDGLSGSTIPQIQPVPSGYDWQAGGKGMKPLAANPTSSPAPTYHPSAGGKGQVAPNPTP